MAILCLSESYEDLKVRLENILVAFTHEGEPVTAKSLNTAGAMMALLKDALMPNLVQTTEGVPAFIHGGPFANIAHGCNSVLATKMALALSDWTITEAGFGFDLGAEKFFDIKCKSAGLDTAAVVLVATCRALKSHGGVDKADINKLNPEAVQKGLANLDRHVENIKQFCEPPIVCLNRFKEDHLEDIDIVRQHCEKVLKVPFAVSNVFEEGGIGGIELAQNVILYAERKRKPFCPLYDWNEDVKTKIFKVANKMYGADEIKYTQNAERDLISIEKLGYQNLPI
jgi:formate--tetrahydrofolate ligase